MLCVIADRKNVICILSTTIHRIYNLWMCSRCIHIATKHRLWFGFIRFYILSATTHRIVNKWKLFRILTATDHIVSACLPQAPAHWKRLSSRNAILGKKPESSKSVKSGKKIAMTGNNKNQKMQKACTFTCFLHFFLFHRINILLTNIILIY